MYNIDFDKLVEWFLPHSMRGENTVILTKSMNSPVTDLYTQFLSSKQKLIYKLQHTSQVCYMEKVLRDAFDPVQRRIYITDFEGLTRVYLWPDSSHRDIDGGVVTYLWPDSYYRDSGIDFTVNIPSDIYLGNGEIDRLHALIKEYKLSSKNYNLNFI